MNKVKSKDGTSIAFDQIGRGPAVILVDGAFTYRGFGPMGELAKLLAPHFTVIDYDRRGRGESSDTQPYTVEREIEDIDALIEEAGRSASVYGKSSGGSLALEASAKLGTKIKKLAIYEPPYNSDPAARQAYKEYRKHLAELIAAGCRDDAVVLFRKYMGTSAKVIDGMRQTPAWSVMESIAPTLAYDAAIMGDDAAAPLKLAADVSTPTLVMNGTAIPFMMETAKALAKAMPHAQQKTLEGQTHDVNLQVLAPILIEYLRK